MDKLTLGAFYDHINAKETFVIPVLRKKAKKDVIDALMKKAVDSDYNQVLAAMHRFDSPVLDDIEKSIRDAFDTDEMKVQKYLGLLIKDFFKDIFSHFWTQWMRYAKDFQSAEEYVTISLNRSAKKTWIHIPDKNEDIEESLKELLDEFYDVLYLKFK